MPLFSFIINLSIITFGISLHIFKSQALIRRSKTHVETPNSAANFIDHLQELFGSPATTNHLARFSSSDFIASAHATSTIKMVNLSNFIITKNNGRVSIVDPQTSSLQIMNNLQFYNSWACLSDEDAIASFSAPNKYCTAPNLVIIEQDRARLEALM